MWGLIALSIIIVIGTVCIVGYIEGSKQCDDACNEALKKEGIDRDD